MVSFIVIGKNEGWRLKKCLDAIWRLAKKELALPYEIIYIDSRSTDGSVDLSKQYADKILLVTGECCAAIGRNIGAKESNGDILFFIDGDMEMREGVMRTLLDSGKELSYPFIAGIENDILFDENWNRKDERPRQRFKENAEWLDNRPSTGMFVIQKKLWEEVGGMDNRFVVSEDYDFGFMACSKGYRILRKGKLWVNHYTQYYALRPNVRLHKYSAMLARKHFFNRYAQRLLIYRFYSAYLLFLGVLLSLVLLSFYAMVPYLAALIYRSSRVVRRTSIQLNWMKVATDRFRKDCLFIYSFFFFHPSMPELKYKRVR